MPLKPELQVTLQMIWVGVRHMPEIKKDLEMRGRIDKLLNAQPYLKCGFGKFNLPNNPYFTNLLILFDTIEKQNISLFETSNQVLSQSSGAQPSSAAGFFLRDNLPALFRKLIGSSAETQINDLLRKAKNEFQIKLKMILSQSDNDAGLVSEAKLFLKDILPRLFSFWNDGLINTKEIKIFSAAYRYLVSMNPLLSEKLLIDMPIMRLYQADFPDCLQQFLIFLEQEPILSTPLRNVLNNLQRKRDLLQVTLQMVWQSLALEDLSDASLAKALNAKPFDRENFLAVLENTKVVASSIKNNNVLGAVAILEEIVTSDESFIRRTPKIRSPISIDSLPQDLWEIVFTEVAKSSPPSLSLFIEDPDFKKISESVTNKPNSPFKNKKLAQNGVWTLSRRYKSDLNFEVKVEHNKICQIIECSDGCLISISSTGDLVRWRPNNEGVYQAQLLHDGEAYLSENMVLELSDRSLVSTNSFGRLIFWHYDKGTDTYTIKGDNHTHSKGSITTLFELFDGCVMSFSEGSSSLGFSIVDKKTNLYKNFYRYPSNGCIQLADGNLMMIGPQELMFYSLASNGQLKKDLTKSLAIPGEHINSVIQLQDSSLAVVTNSNTLTRWVYNNIVQRFEKTHVGQSNESVISRLMQLQDGSVITYSYTLNSPLIQWVFNSETENFQIKQVLDLQSKHVDFLTQLQDQSLLYTTMDDSVILWKLNAQDTSFSKPIYLERIDSQNHIVKICQLKDGSLIIADQIGSLRHYTFETLNEIFKRVKASFNVVLKTALQKQKSHASSVEFLNNLDPLEKQKCYLRALLCKLRSLLIGLAYIDEQEIKVFLGAYQYLIFQDRDLQENRGKTKQFLELMEATLALPIFALYKGDRACMQAFADFLLQERDLPGIFDEARLFFHNSQKTLRNF